MPTQPTTNNLEGWEKEWWKLWCDFTNHIRSDKEVFQFFKDLRKHDELELIKILNNFPEISINKELAVSFIKDYYNK